MYAPRTLAGRSRHTDVRVLLSETSVKRKQMQTEPTGCLNLARITIQSGDPGLILVTFVCWTQTMRNVTILSYGAVLA